MFAPFANRCIAHNTTATTGEAKGYLLGCAYFHLMGRFNNNIVYATDLTDIKPYILGDKVMLGVESTR